MRRMGRIVSLALLVALALQTAAPGLAAAQLTREEQAVPPVVVPAQQMTPDDEARVLLELAGRLRDAGEIAAARLVLRDIVARYDGTVSAAQALETLRGLPAEPPPGSPAPAGGGSAGGANAPGGGTPRAPGVPASRMGGGLDQSGRVPVIVYSTLMSAWVALSIPIVADAQGSPPYGLALLAGAPVGLLSSIYLTRHRTVTATQADLFTLAGNWGLFHGLAFGVISDGEGKDVAGSAALGGLLGVGLGAMLAAPGHNRESTVALSSLGTTYGAWLGLVGAELITSGDSGPSDNRVFAGMLTGGDACLVSAVLVGPHVTLSRSRSRLIGVGGTAGALVGLGFNLLFDVKSRRAEWGMLGAGTLAGLAGGVALTSDYDTDRGFSDPGRAQLLPPGLVPWRGGVGVELLSARF